MKLLTKRALHTLAMMICVTIGMAAERYTPQNLTVSLALKVPGNEAKVYPLSMKPAAGNGDRYELVAAESIPVTITQQVIKGSGTARITVVLQATERIYFNYRQILKTGISHDQSLFYMPGFWYRRNLRSPKEAPSFHTADSWTVSEDRLSAPMTGVYDERSHRYITVLRIDDFQEAALTTHKEGDVIVSGKTSLGFTGFENRNGESALDFGFPYQETPKSYIRKLTLAPPVRAFQKLEKGENITLTWEIHEGEAADYSDFIWQTWAYNYDIYQPKPVDTPFSTERMKEVLSQFFINSYVGDKPLKFYPGVELLTFDCRPVDIAEVGFIGRVLLNAFNALEYVESHDNKLLAAQSQAIFESYLQHGFSETGFFKEVVDFSKDYTPVHSIRRQSEAIYATLRFLTYEKEKGRKHPEWEKHLKAMLDQFLRLQLEDGSFPRKFRDDYSVVDPSGGSTPSATLPLVMGYKYFKDKRYLKSAENTADYLEKAIISQSDYFSSMLDANCEDKEASLYAATAMYYLSLVTKGEQSNHYASLSKQATYFALSWYYLWDVPFATGQMLGDIGLKTRGWGNVSVENNHIDAFVFEFASVLNGLAERFNEPRFSEFTKVMNTSLQQLLPFEGHQCGIALPGFYPEVVQHTNWDYGRNGKGFYNLHFAPGWVVASLWELLTPGRVEQFLQPK